MISNKADWLAGLSFEGGGNYFHEFRRNSPIFTTWENDQAFLTDFRKEWTFFPNRQNKLLLSQNFGKTLYFL